MGISVETLAAAKKYADKVATSSGGSVEGLNVEVAESSSTSYAKVYSIKQGGTVVGTINIPKDMVVQSGQIVKNPSGQTAGTYLELTLANTDNTKIYISVSDLIDIYTVEANATQIQLAIDGSNKLSAKIVAGSISSTELSTEINNSLNASSVHINKTVSSETGAHGLRYYNGALQYDNNGTWTTINISELLI